MHYSSLIPTATGTETPWLCDHSLCTAVIFLSPILEDPREDPDEKNLLILFVRDSPFVCSSGVIINQSVLGIGIEFPIRVDLEKKKRVDLVSTSQFHTTFPATHLRELLFHQLHSSEGHSSI